MAFFKPISFLLVAVAVIFFFIIYSGGLSKGIETVRDIVGDKHAAALLMFSAVVAVLIIFGAGVVRDNVTIRDILFIPQHESEE
ncbi:MAG: hypothetical protein OYG31_01020 [Candidatus Kaiserbacteria bacterium]|nr:hypothetical protein [Candidatus Kaiserbacteria bacterium]